MEAPRLLLVTDAAFADDVVLGVIAKVGRALPRGAFAVQLRDKLRPPSARAAWGARLREATREVGVALVVNGDVALARAVGADGIHFGGKATDEEVARGVGLWRSMAAHTDEDVTDARARGVDAVLVSPVYATPGKGVPRGTKAIEAACALAGPMKVLALGGVGTETAQACLDAGAFGVAVIRALLEAAHPEETARPLLGRR